MLFCLTVTLQVTSKKLEMLSVLPRQLVAQY